MLHDPRIEAAVSELTIEPIFITVSGAHLYGFESADSDVDLRACHVASPRDALGLFPPNETVDRSWLLDGLEMDVVSHEATKFFRMLLKPNGYVLEQVLSPLVVRTSPEHEQLIALAPRLLTWRHAHHYLGLATSQLKLFERDDPPRPKPLLYVYRALLVGLHLMREGEIEPNLPRLIASRGETAIEELLQLKRSSGEKQGQDIPGLEEHLKRISALRAELEDAKEKRPLPDEPSATEELNELLLSLRGLSSAG